MKALVRLLAWIFLAVALFAAARDGYLRWLHGGLRWTDLGTTWFMAHADSLQLAEPAIARHIHVAGVEIEGASRPTGGTAPWAG